MKRFLISAVIATALGSPALAQAYDPDLGTGNIVNVEPVQPTVMKPQPARRSIGCSPAASLDCT